ncbi:MAG: HAMP domain-containing sensor histidine kinase [Eubacteriales bacterium]|nr:HAMP domain-containing sensor histidine kinase [Eubacteriales bacterium]
MLTYDEQEKIERLVAKDENAQKLITAIRNDYHLTLSQISHEIRNPLTYVNSSVQWIQKMHPEVEGFEFWDQMKNDLQYMRILLDDISAFNNGDHLNISRIDPKEFACDLKDTLLPELIRRHIPLLIKLDDTYPDFYGDPVRLKQVFINLITNAMESITERGRITLKIFTHDKRLLIAVRDNGCGIPPEQQQTIFRPFVTYKEHGTGLGLAIARRIVSAHNGTIHLKSTVGKGTEFQVYLPLLPISHICI